MEAWRIEHNSYRPHSSSDDLTVDEFIENIWKRKRREREKQGTLGLHSGRAMHQVQVIARLNQVKGSALTEGY